MFVRQHAHSGRQISLVALFGVLAVTGCVNFTHNASPSFVNWWPAWQTIGQRQETPPVIQQVIAEKPAATFIVRFRDEPILAEIGKSFRRDQAGAQAKFRAWQSNHPEMRGLTLIRAGYSGELLVGLPMNDALQRSPRDVLAALRGMENIVYAETDEIAHPGTGK